MQSSIETWMDKALSNKNDNANGHCNIVSFTTKDKKLYVPVVTLSAKDNQKLSKPFSKGFESIIKK